MYTTYVYESYLGTKVFWNRGINMLRNLSVITHNVYTCHEERDHHDKVQ